METDKWRPLPPSVPAEDARRLGQARLHACPGGSRGGGTTGEAGWLKLGAVTLGSLAPLGSWLGFRRPKFHVFCLSLHIHTNLGTDGVEAAGSLSVTSTLSKRQVRLPGWGSVPHHTHPAKPVSMPPPCPSWGHTHRECTSACQLPILSAAEWQKAGRRTGWALSPN